MNHTTSLSNETAAEHDQRPLRIALLGLGRYSGGGPITFHLASVLSRTHEVQVFLGSEGRNLNDWLVSGMHVDVAPVYRSVVGAAWSILTGVRIRRLGRRIESFAPDVVIVPFFHVWHPWLVRLLTRPLVVFVHDPEPHPGISGYVYHALERRLIRHAKHVVILSSAFRPIMQSVYGVPADCLSVVPMGPLTNYQRCAPCKHRPLADPERPVLLFFGRVEKYKGIEILLEAFPLVREAVPGATVRIVGKGWSAKLRDRAQHTLGVEVDDRWINDAEIPKIFAEADIVVLPYTTATQSGVIPIAAAFALPVVATRTGGLPEQLAEGACGVLVEPGDSAGLAQALVDMIKRPDQSLAVGRALHDEYSLRRSWDTIASSVAIACRHAILRMNT